MHLEDPDRVTARILPFCGADCRAHPRIYGFRGIELASHRGNRTHHMCAQVRRFGHQHPARSHFCILGSFAENLEHSVRRSSCDRVRSWGICIRVRFEHCGSVAVLALIAGCANGEDVSGSLAFPDAGVSGRAPGATSGAAATSLEVAATSLEVAARSVRAATREAAAQARAAMPAAATVTAAQARAAMPAAARRQAATTVAAGPEDSGVSCADPTRNLWWRVCDSPATGCGLTGCTACPGTANGLAVCNGTACDLNCNDGFVRSGNTCVPPTAPSCTDNLKNQTETDVDCGGGCPPCPNQKACVVPGDCQTKNCASNVCAPPACVVNGAKDGNETGTDCGGGCATCPIGQDCDTNTDCTNGNCVGGVCTCPAGPTRCRRR